MFTMQLDISYEAAHEEVVQFAHDHDCRVLSRLEEGSGGGNPVYTFASDTYNPLKDLAEDLYGCSLDNTFLMNKIIPYVGVR
jgi:hypothetical protein